MRARCHSMISPQSHHDQKCGQERQHLADRAVVEGDARRLPVRVGDHDDGEDAEDVADHRHGQGQREQGPLPAGRHGHEVGQDRRQHRHRRQRVQAGAALGDLQGDGRVLVGQVQAHALGVDVDAGEAGDDLDGGRAEALQGRTDLVNHAARRRHHEQQKGQRERQRLRHLRAQEVQAQAGQGEHERVAHGAVQAQPDARDLDQQSQAQHQEAGGGAAAHRRLLEARPAHPDQKRRQRRDQPAVHVFFVVPAVHEAGQGARIHGDEQQQQRHRHQSLFRCPCPGHCQCSSPPRRWTR